MKINVGYDNKLDNGDILNGTPQDFFTNPSDTILLISFILTFGLFTSFISSFLVTQKYLKLKFVR